MTSGSDRRHLVRGAPSAPVFSPREAATVSSDVHLHPYLAITTDQAAGLLAALGEYAARALLRPICVLLGFERAVVGPIAIASLHELKTFWQRRSIPALLRTEHGAIDSKTANGFDRLVFGESWRQVLSQDEYTRGRENLSLAELCFLLRRVDRFALNALPMRPLPHDHPVLARIIHAHNALIAFRGSPIGYDAFCDRTASIASARREAVESQVPDYLEPILGWRMWRVTGTHGNAPGAKPTLRLTSVSQPTIWEPYRALHAHPMPFSTSAGSGGIHAFKDLVRARSLHVYPPDRPHVVGQVSLWGQFIEHQYGWRAQFAYPARLVLGRGCDPSVLAAIYGIPYERDSSPAPPAQELAVQITLPLSSSRRSPRVTRFGRARHAARSFFGRARALARGCQA